MIDTKIVRDEAISKFRKDIPEIDVEPFPNNPNDYIPKHPKGTLVVAIHGINFSKPNINQQSYMLTLRATLMLRSMIDSSEMLNMLDRVRQSLTNDFYPYGSRFYCVSQETIGESNNIWYYRIIFVLPGIIIQGG